MEAAHKQPVLRTPNCLALAAQNLQSARPLCLRQDREPSVHCRVRGVLLGQEQQYEHQRSTTADRL